jgi:hypothetical protein
MDSWQVGRDSTGENAKVPLLHSQIPSIVLGLEECTKREGNLGNLENFTKLVGLVMPLEVLIGEPRDGLQLEDTIPIL